MDVYFRKIWIWTQLENLLSVAILMSKSGKSRSYKHQIDKQEISFCNNLSVWVLFLLHLHLNWISSSAVPNHCFGNHSAPRNSLEVLPKKLKILFFYAEIWKNMFRKILKDALQPLKGWETSLGCKAIEKCLPQRQSNKLAPSIGHGFF